MKASKILAGLSAASIAASMLSMISFADDTSETKVLKEGTIAYSKLATEATWGTDTGVNESLKDIFAAWGDLTKYDKVTVNATISDAEGTTADKFGLTFYDMDSSTWTWNVTGEGSFVDNTVTYDIALESLNPKGSEEIGDIGLQVHVNDATVGTEYKANVSYTITATEKKADDSSSATDESGLPAPVALPEVETNIEQTFKFDEHEYVGNYNTDGRIPLEIFQTAAENDAPVFLTINTTRLDGYGYAQVAPVDEHGWSKLYDESVASDSKYGWMASSISGLRLKSALSDEQLAEVTEPVLQNDGFVNLPGEAKDYEFTIALSPEAVNSIVASAEDEPADDGSLWGGLLFQVYGSKINSVVAKTVGEAPKANPASTGTGKVNGYLMFAASDWSQSLFPFDDDNNPTENAVYAAINEDGTYSLTYNNEFDVFKTDADSSIPGALIYNIDFPGVYSGSNGNPDAEGNKYNDDNPRQLLYPDFDVSIDSILVDGVEIQFDKDKILKGNIENQTNNYRVELYNEYGATKSDPAFDPALITGDTVTVNFTVTGLEKKGEDKPEPEPEPVPTPAPSGALFSKEGVVVTKLSAEAPYFAASLDGNDLELAKGLEKYRAGTRLYNKNEVNVDGMNAYFDYFDSQTKDNYAVMTTDEYDQFKAAMFGYATKDDNTFDENAEKIVYPLGSFEYAGVTFTVYKQVNVNGKVTVCIVYPNPYQTGRYSAVVPALWPLIDKEDLINDTLNLADEGGQLDFADPYNWTDTCSKDLYDDIRRIHDTDPKANVTFTFKAIGTPEGTPVAAFLKCWSAHYADEVDVKKYPDAYEKGQLVWCVYGTNDWKKWDEVGTKSSPTGEFEEDSIEFPVQYTEVKDKTKIANGEYDVATSNGKYYNKDDTKKTTQKVKMNGSTYYLPQDEKHEYGVTTEKKPKYAWKVQTTRNTKYSTDKKWDTTSLTYDPTGYEDGPCYKDGSGAIILVPKKDWHDYYFTNEGLVDVQSTRGMAAGITNNTKFSQMTGEQINYIKKDALENGAPGIFYNDVDGDHYVKKNVINGVDSCYYPYGHFIIFGDGETMNEYSFTLSAAAIDQILEKSERSAGAVLPYSIATWTRPQAAMHGPIWLQAHEEAVPVLAIDGKRNIDARVYSSTNVRTPEEIPYLYGKSDYKGMYALYDENGNIIECKKEDSSSTATATATAAASSPTASSATTDANSDTGAAAGFGIAGLLLAGAAMVCAKKKH